MVADALDDLPDELLHVLDNVVVQVVDRNPDDPTILGLYDGVPHTERSGHEGPDIVSIYRVPLCETTGAQIVRRNHRGADRTVKPPGRRSGAAPGGGGRQRAVENGPERF